MKAFKPFSCTDGCMKTVPIDETLVNRKAGILYVARPLFGHERIKAGQPLATFPDKALGGSLFVILNGKVF